MGEAESVDNKEPRAAVQNEAWQRLTRITVAAFFTADHVVAVDGKLYANGGFFNMLRFATYPAIAPVLGIGISLIVPWHAYQQDHRFVVTLRDEDDRELPLRIEGAFRVGADILLRHGDPSVVNLAGNVTRVVFERPGHYHLALQVNGEELARWYVQVIQLPTEPLSVATSGRPRS
jgi:hypothetical protein